MVLHSLVIHPGDGLPVPALGMVRKVDAGHLEGRMLIMEGVAGPGHQTKIKSETLRGL
jgi:hypothetical protein